MRGFPSLPHNFRQRRPLVQQERSWRPATATKGTAKTTITSLLVSYTSLATAKKNEGAQAPKRARTALKGCPENKTDALLLLPLRRAGQAQMWSMQGPLVLFEGLPARRLEAPRAGLHGTSQTGAQARHSADSPTYHSKKVRDVRL